jgi:potassium efflux system protein
MPIPQRQRLWIRTATVLIACAWLTPVWAQLPAIPGIPHKDSETTSGSTPEDAAKRLDDWQKQASETLSRLEGKAPPDGISQTELESRVRNAEQLLFGIATIRKENELHQEAKKATEDARERSKAWSGFETNPPYSILMLDQLEDERASKSAKLTLLESSQSTLEHLLRTSLEEAQKAESEIDRAIQTVQSATTEQLEVAKWRLEAVRQSSRLQAVRSMNLRARRDTIEEQVTGAKVEVARIDRMIQAARPYTKFLASDMAQIKKVAAEQQGRLLKESDAILKRINLAMSERRKLQPELDSLIRENPESPEANLQRLRVTTADVRLECLRSIRDSIEGLLQIEKATHILQQHRWDMLAGVETFKREKIVEDLTRYSERFKDWLNLIKIEQETAMADMSNIDARRQSLSKDDPRLSLFEEQRTARNEELEMIRRIHLAVDQQRKLMRRWLKQLAPEAEDEEANSPWRMALSKAFGFIPSVWSYELMTFENKVVVDGETITGKVPLTVAMLVKALLFFFIGYWIAVKLANRVRHGVVTRGHIGEAQAKTLANWAMLVVGFMLLLGTLSFLKIPLTVFAFFGGALAIGIGFGTQTLIKNFISGIILLFERKIRVGDIIDVDGIVGTVTEVNTRSSIIRSPDDVETMIPNSLFLENRVTNWTLTQSRQRRSVRVSVAYGSDTRGVMDILKECADRHGLVCKDPAPFAVFDDFGESALIFSLYFWYDFHSEGNAMVVASDLRLMIEKRFTESGIGVPFPQRDMHLTTTEPIRVQIAQDHE